MAPRKEASERLEQLVAAGTRVFGARGFRRTRIDDVAAVAGVSPGNVYRYVAGKDALFRLVLERAIEGPDWPLPDGPFPLNGTSVDETVEWAGRRLDFSDFTVLGGALKRRRRGPVADELDAIVDELFAIVHRTRHATRMLERSAPDMPELAQMFFAVRRELFDRITRYIETRIRRGDFLPLRDPAVTARLLVEATVWAANRRLDEPDPSIVIADDDARAALRELARRTLIGAEQ